MAATIATPTPSMQAGADQLLAELAPCERPVVTTIRA